nr:cation transporter [Pseudoclavibacter sp. Marseille-Q3772]
MAGSLDLRRTALLVAVLNLLWFFVQTAAAIVLGSVSLFADAVDHLEDTAINLLIVLALGFSLRRRARAGRVMAFILLLPAIAACVQAVRKFQHPEAPDPVFVALAALGALLINGVCAWLLHRFRTGKGSLSKAAWLAARNDVIVNILILAMAGITALQGTGVPDLILGIVILLLNLRAAWEVWEAAGEEQLAAKAAGELD